MLLCSSLSSVQLLRTIERPCAFPASAVAWLAPPRGDGMKPVHHQLARPQARTLSSLLASLQQLWAPGRARYIPRSPTNGSLPDASSARISALRLLRRSELLLLALVAFASLAFILSFWAGGPSDGLPHAHSSMLVSSHARHVADELLLRQLVEECAKRQNTVIYVNARGRMVVLGSLPAAASCPLLDIALRGSERGVGMCTDVALYVLHGHGRIIPLLGAAELQAYEARCRQRTARMFLESMYHEWISPSPGVTHIMQVNNEHMHAVQFKLHKKMDLFLCKTRFCQRLVKQYVRARNLKADVWYMGHTSSDPTVGQQSHSSRWRRGWYSAGRRKDSASNYAVQSMAAVPGGGGPSRAPDSTAPAALQLHDWPDYSQFLHVKGKSGLKHSKQVLECWSRHAGFPQLTVIGDNPFDEGPTQAVLDRPNVKLIPRPLPKQPPVPRRPQPGQEDEQPGGAVTDESDAAGVHAVHGRSDPQLTTFDAIRKLEAGIGIHICASEREGFGHYLNEARAVGALVLTTDHPPMNEFVVNGTSGLLVTPDSTGSWSEWQALGNFSHINAFLSTESLCKGVERVLSLSIDERRRLGVAARRAFLEDRQRFLRKMRFFVEYLRLQSDEHTSIHE